MKKEMQVNYKKVKRSELHKDDMCIDTSPILNLGLFQHSYSEEF